MITVPTRELKQFFASSSFVQHSNALPVLDYMMIKCDADGTYLYYTDLESYFIQHLDIQNEVGSVMVEYKYLSDFVKNINSDAVTFTLKDKGVLISDGKNKIARSTVEASLFPRVPVINTGGVVLSDDSVSTLKRASLFLNKDPNDLFTTHVFMGKGYICASDRNFAHYAKAETPFEAALYKKAIMALPGACVFSLSESYYTFSTLKSTYLFSKTEAQFFDMTSVPAKRPETAVCILNKEEFLSYLLVARGQCKYELCAVDIKKSKETLYCHMVDPLYGAICDRKIDAECTEFDFRFNADYMVTILKLMDGELIHMYLDGHKLFVSDETNHLLTIIMRIHDINQQ